MRKIDFPPIFEKLTIAYGGRLQNNPETLDVYYLILKDLPTALVRAAALDYMASPAAFPPSPGEIRACAINLQKRGNLFMGPGKPHAIGKAMDIVRYGGGDGPNHVIDYNAYRTGLPGKPFKVGQQEFATLKEMATATGLDRNSVAVNDYSVFEGASEPSHAMSNNDPLVDPMTVNVMPAAGAPIVDAGAEIPGVTQVVNDTEVAAIVA